MGRKTIYVVDNGQAKRLVRGNNRQQALRHVALDTHEVRVATQDDLLEMLGDNVPVEDAGASAEAEQ